MPVSLSSGAEIEGDLTNFDFEFEFDADYMGDYNENLIINDFIDTMFAGGDVKALENCNFEGDLTCF